MNFKQNYKTLLIFTVLTIITFFVSQKNILGVLDYPNIFYADASQKDESETLILGKIFADKYHMTIPKKANLGFVSINELVYEPSYLFQSYGLVQEYLPDIELKLEKINDVNWSNGIAKDWTGFVVKQDDRVSYYVGRNIVLQNGESRIITKISNYDKYANIYISGTIIEPNIIDASETIKLSGKPIHTESILLTPYVSQYGIGGIMFS